MPRMARSPAAPLNLPVVELWYDAIVVRIHGLIHLHFKLSEYLGFQSWTDGQHNYKIEVQLRGGAIQTHYDSREKWKAVLQGLERILLPEKYE